jgi:hypothetical protein
MQPLYKVLTHCANTYPFNLNESKYMKAFIGRIQTLLSKNSPLDEKELSEIHIYLEANKKMVGIEARAYASTGNALTFKNPLNTYYRIESDFGNEYNMFVHQQTLLALALKNHHWEVVKMFLEAGADPKKGDEMFSYKPYMETRKNPVYKNSKLSNCLDIAKGNHAPQDILDMLKKALALEEQSEPSASVDDDSAKKHRM